MARPIYSVSKKLSTSSRPLGHRPIALLNSYNKNFTKILANRLQALLPSVVDPAQVGFVPGRHLATALDIFAAAKVALKNEDAIKDAIFLLLDFSKAYDTLQRPFLLAVLNCLGFRRNLSPSSPRSTRILHAGSLSKFFNLGVLK